jgi:predicted site-specific integrase-resolvase
MTEEKQTVDRPWVHLKEVAAIMGLKYNSAKNLVYAGKFPMPTYKLGRYQVVDRGVVDAYFDLMHKRGLKELRKKVSVKRVKAAQLATA